MMNRLEAFNMLPQVGTMISKVGANKGVARSRIWIEGKRLIAAGFHRGAPYQRSWDNEGQSLYLATVISSHDDSRIFKVSGKDMKPIIDITGKRVVTFFDGHVRVLVEYREGIIRISGAGGAF